MADYFKSKQVTVYPCSYRGKFNSTDKTIKQVDPEANMFTENTIRKSGLRINGKDTGLISFGTNAAEPTKYDIEVLIHGYYFKITEIAFTDLAAETDGDYTDTKYLQIATNKTIALGNRKTEILISQDPDNVDYLDTDGDDENGNFVGLKIVNNPNTSYYIKPCLLNSTKDGLVANEEEKQVNVRHGAGVNSININLDDAKPNITQGDGTVTIGNNNTNNDDYNIVIGEDNTVSGTHSLAIGTKLNIDTDYAVAIGQPNTGLTTPTAATGNFAFAHGSTALANGNYSYARGTQTIAGGDYSFAAGYSASASNSYSYAFGASSSAAADYAHAEGNSSVADGEYSYAFGGGANAHGGYSRAIGTVSTTYSDYSYAMGSNCTAGDANNSDNKTNGIHAHAEGNNAKATGNYSHAEGNNTTATGDYSYAWGYQSTASGNNSHAGGTWSVVSGANSFAHGNNLTANGLNQAVFGRFNTPSADSLFIIGNGSISNNDGSENDEPVIETSNILEIHQDKAILNGDLILDNSLNSANITSIKSGCAIQTEAATALHIDFMQSKSLTLDNYTDSKISFCGYDCSIEAGMQPVCSEQKRVIIYNKKVAGTADAGTLEVNGGIKTALGCYFGGDIESTNKVTAVSFYAKSDKRLKENITSYKPEKSILDLPVYKYDFINGSKNQIGCLAQDLQEICPELVESGKDGYLHIQESKLVYLLLEEVKELKKEVKELKDKR